jgi:hypothetical protein
VGFVCFLFAQLAAEQRLAAEDTVRQAKAEQALREKKIEEVRVKNSLWHVFFCFFVFVNSVKIWQEMALALSERERLATEARRAAEMLRDNELRMQEAKAEQELRAAAILAAQLATEQDNAHLVSELNRLAQAHAQV